ncbi:hypothetical protein YPSE1_45410 (plasmid) [Yersinia pseudotuberculosis]|nr:hypothetical protein YPSE1_45410 [Yersinia pseudotuberculosis]
MLTGRGHLILPIIIKLQRGYVISPLFIKSEIRDEEMEFYSRATTSDRYKSTKTFTLW